MTHSTPPATPANPIGIEGLEFIEYATAAPAELGRTLETMGFSCIARHRSREVLLYRQGAMTIVVNADPEMLSGTSGEADVVISGIAFRVADARRAYQHMVDLGAWPIPTRAGAMELNIPGVHGVGDSIIYLVDRYRDFSIYDVDFIYREGVSRQPPAVVPGMHLFGLVQYVGPGRMDEWVDFYNQLLGFSLLAPGESFGILPHGCLLQSPCGQFYLQLVGPPDDLSYDLEWDERFARLGFGVPDVAQAVSLLQARGVAFEETGLIHVTEKGALTRMFPGKTHFELVASRSGAAG